MKLVQSIRKRYESDKNIILRLQNEGKNDMEKERIGRKIMSAVAVSFSKCGIKYTQMGK